MRRALARCMKAKKLDDVLVYRKSVALADEISAILERPVFRTDLELKDQRSAPRHGLTIDRQMADYYGRARGSALESRGHLARAAGKKFITNVESTNLGNSCTEISKMLTPVRRASLRRRLTTGLSTFDC